MFLLDLECPLMTEKKILRWLIWMDGGGTDAVYRSSPTKFRVE